MRPGINTLVFDRRPGVVYMLRDDSPDIPGSPQAIMGPTALRGIRATGDSLSNVLSQV